MCAMSILWDAFKNVFRTFLSLVIVGALIYGGIGAWQNYKNMEENNTEIADNSDVDEEENLPTEEEIEDEESEVTFPFETITFKEGEIEEEKGFSRTGNIELNNEITVSTDLPGNVEQVLVKVGDEVQLDQTLFTIRENTSIKSLRLNLELAENQLRIARENFALAQQSANVSEASFGTQIASANLALEQAVLGLESSRDIAEKQNGLNDINSFVAEETAAIQEEAQAQVTMNNDNENVDQQIDRRNETLNFLQEDAKFAQNQLSQTQNYYSDLGQLLQIENAKRQIESVQNQIASQRIGTQQSLKQLESQIVSAESQVNQAKLQLDQTSMKAPVNGKVIAVDLSVGEAVNPGQTYVTIAGDSSKIVKVFVTASQVGSLKVGQNVDVAYSGDKLKGKIKDIALKADDRNKLIEVKIGDISGQENLLTNGFARVNFEPSGEKIVSGGVSFPLAKLKIENGSYLAPVLTDGEIEYKTVEIAGPIVKGRVLLVGGLNNGDEVVLNASEYIASNL